MLIIGFWFCISVLSAFILSSCSKEYATELRNMIACKAIFRP